jgi:hypothetical protein
MVKLIGALLGIGGAAGVGIGLWTYSRLFSQTGTRLSAATALLGAFVLAFGWSTWIGVDLWRGRPQAYKWAEILLALQIPTISIPGFAYRFYTGMMLCLSFNLSEGKLGFEFQLASLLVFKILPEPQDLILGVNLVAIAAFLYLIHASRQRRKTSANGDGATISTKP